MIQVKGQVPASYPVSVAKMIEPNMNQFGENLPYHKQ